MSIPRPSVTPLELELRNDLSELERLFAAVESWAERAGLATELGLRLNLVLDELLTNIISYAFPDEAAHRISVAVWIGDGLVVAQIRDDGKAFDPFTQAPLPDLDSDLALRTAGGVGVHLARTFMETVSYRRVDGCNEVRVSNSIGRP